jgi:putative transposase
VALDRQGHTARALWNLLDEWYTCGNGGIARRPSVADIDRQLRAARIDPLPGWEWLAELPAQATQQVLKHYLRTWDRFYQGAANPPRLKKRNARLAVDVPQASQLHVTRVSRRWGEVTIPLVGRVRFRWTRPLPGVSRDCPGRITGGRLIKDPLGWRICFRFEETAIEVPPNHHPPVGLDRGVAHTMALSDGRNLDMPALLRSGERRRLRKLELQAARQRAAHAPGARVSNRERRTHEQIAGLRARQARRREDWLHNKTTDLARHHSLVVVEDLKIKNMTRSARGTIENPGTNVRAKSGLNRAILGMAWGKAERMLDYKCLRRVVSWSRSTLRTPPRPARGADRWRPRVVRAGSGSAVWRVAMGRRRIRTRRRWCLRVDSSPLAAPPQGIGVAGRGAFATGQAVKRQPPAEAMAPSLL